jgi:hypothetical protein
MALSHEQNNSTHMVLTQAIIMLWQHLQNQDLQQVLQVTMAIWYYVVLGKDNGNFHDLLKSAPYMFQLTMEGGTSCIILESCKCIMVRYKTTIQNFLLQAKKVHHHMQTHKHISNCKHWK